MCCQTQLQKLIDNAWMECKKEHKQNQIELRIDDIVLAKVRGHQPWPATVLDVTNKKRIKFEFFGAEEYERFGFVSMNEIALFENGSLAVRLILKKRIQKYRKAIQEAEIICGIPQFASLCNE